MNKTPRIHRFLDVHQEPNKWLTPIEGYETRDLVSLGKAVEPVKSLMHNLDVKVFVAKQSSEKPSDGLTADESAAVYLYTMQWSDSAGSLYNILNQRLRSEKRHDLKSWFSYLKLILTALAKLPPVKKTVWRIVEGDIQCTSGRFIRSHSHFPDENEILLMPGTYFRVLKKYTGADDVHNIELEEAKPLYPWITPPSKNLALHVYEKPIDARFLSGAKADEYRNEAIKNTSLLNSMRQTFQIKYRMAKNITNEDLHRLYTEATDAHLKSLYKDILLVGNAETILITNNYGKNNYEKGLVIFRRRWNGKFDLLVAYAVQSNELGKTRVAGYGVTAICIGAAAGLLTLNPIVAVGTAAGIAAMGSAKVTYDFLSETSDVVCGYMLDELVKNGLIKINCYGEVELVIDEY